jgi:hypothetical protein
MEVLVLLHECQPALELPDDLACLADDGHAHDIQSGCDRAAA